MVKNTRVDRNLVTAERPDAVVLASGARPYMPDLLLDGGIQVVDAWQVLRREVRVGARVLVADWRCDWIGPGIAELLAREGSHVQLAVNGTHAGETLPLYVRDNLAAELHRLRIAVTPYARLYGGDGDTVYMQHTTSGEPLLFEGIDTLVLCLGHAPQDELAADLRELVDEVHLVGDCLTPRTAEEAVYEGLRVGWQL